MRVSESEGVRLRLTLTARGAVHIERMLAHLLSSPNAMMSWSKHWRMVVFLSTMSSMSLSCGFGGYSWNCRLICGGGGGGTVEWGWRWGWGTVQWGWGWGDSGVGVEVGVGDSAVGVGVGGQCSGGLRVGELLTVVPLRSLGACPPQAPSSTLGPRPLWQGCGLCAEEDPTPGTRHQSVDDHHLRKTSYDVTRCHVVHHVTSYEIMWFIMQCNIWYVISGDTVHCVMSCDSHVMSCTTTCDVMQYIM